MDRIQPKKFAVLLKSRLPLIAAVTLGVTAIVGFSSLFQPSKYRGQFQLLIAAENNYKSQITAENNQKINAKNGSYATEIAILSSPKVIQPIIEDLARKYPDLEYHKLISSQENSPLKITRTAHAGIVEISYEDRNLEKIQDVLDSLADGYLHHSLETEKKQFDRGIAHLEAELMSAENELENLRIKKQIFKEKYGQIEPEKQLEVLAQKLIELETEFFNTKVKLNEHKSHHQTLQSQLGHDTKTAMAVSYLTESERYQQLLDRLQEIELQIAKGASIWKEDSPMLASLQDKKAKLIPLLQQQARASLGNNVNLNLTATTALSSSSALRLELNQQFILAANQVKILQFRSNALSEAIKTLNQKIAAMPPILTQYDRLDREENRLKRSKQRLILAKEALELEAAQQTNLWQTLSNPKISSKPISPNSGLNLSLGLLSGLMLGLIAALANDRGIIDDRVLSSKSLQKPKSDSF